MATNMITTAPDGSRFRDPRGLPFFPVIVNYVGHSDRAWEQFQPGKFDPALIEADWRLAKRAGANVIRTFVDDPLQNEFPYGDFSKLDALVAAAERAGVYLLLALADYNVSYLRTLAAHVALIAVRYAGRPAILGYDLKNEPRFKDIVLLHYPQPIPLFDPALSQTYPPARSRGEALAWARQVDKVPEWLTDDQAVCYANAREMLQSCTDAITAWIKTRNYRGSAVEFIRAPESARWQPFLQALDATLQAWLAPQLAAVRAADPGRPVTVAWSDPFLAGLPANSQLDFLSINRYTRGANTPGRLEYELSIAASLRAAFPRKAVVLTELGFSTFEISPAQVGIAEAAAWLRAFAMGLAGVGKWMLWDLPPGPNDYERNLGLFDPHGNPKPNALALAAVSEFVAPTRSPRGEAALSADATGGIAYRYIADDACGAGGQGEAGDAAARWTGAGWGQLFVNCARPGAVQVHTTAAGQVSLDLGRLIGLQNPQRYTLTAAAAPVSHTLVGSVLTFPATPGQPTVFRLPLEAVDAKIVILWPHGNAPVSEARLANLTAHLTYPDSRMCAPCDFAAETTLWRALNNEPAAAIARGARRLAEIGGRRVPVWDFNDVDVSAARDPKNKLYFSVRVAGIPYRANVWVHGVDARTFLPQQVQPQGYVIGKLANPPAELDARIQILWPHGGAAVADARLANITVDLFQPGTRQLVVPEPRPVASGPAPTLATWQPRLWLVRSVNNGVGQRVASGELRRDGAAAHWDFNDIDVSPGRDPQSKLHFWIETDDLRVCSNFWTHGLDARTYLPHPDVLVGDCV